MNRSDITPGYELVVAADWLPVRNDGGQVTWRDRPGGIARALGQQVAARRGAWVGRDGGDGLAEGPYEGLWLHPLRLDPDLADDYYHGHCVQTVAALAQGCGPVEFRAPWREAYRQVNRQFAATVARLAAPGGTVWIHDHHLQLVPAALRRARPDLRIGFFLHGLFPPVEAFLRQPLRRELLTGLLGADVVGFQQAHSARNFLDLARDLGGLRGGDTTVQVGARTVAVHTAPTSIDAGVIEGLATDPDVRERAAGIRASLGDPDVVLLSVGRPDPAEGVEGLLDAYDGLLASGRLDPARTVLVHLSTCGDEADTVQPERLARVHRKVAQINGEFARVGRPVVHDLCHELDRAELVAFYVAADVLLALPLRQGMTLTAKEYVAARAADTGQVVLSEFTGAAIDLPEALVVNPHDADAVADAVTVAARTSNQPGAGMRTMRDRVRRADLSTWADGFLAALAAPLAAGSARPGPLADEMSS
ncbi:alpha,alpha-trehalose-phosphate synthase (UDP-forming) [Luedemannella helvata]|uniref:Trehalose-6-phosphate synthase n=1 Tax=Luedemannella helvata TaxID=349315 RepID=A0ABP4XC44_9ACTN